MSDLPGSDHKLNKNKDSDPDVSEQERYAARDMNAQVDSISQEENIRLDIELFRQALVDTIHGNRKDEQLRKILCWVEDTDTRCERSFEVSTRCAYHADTEHMFIIRGKEDNQKSGMLQLTIQYSRRDFAKPWISTEFTGPEFWFRSPAEMTEKVTETFCKIAASIKISQSAAAWLLALSDHSRENKAILDDMRTEKQKAPGSEALALFRESRNTKINDDLNFNCKARELITPVINEVLSELDDLATGSDYQDVFGNLGFDIEIEGRGYHAASGSFFTSGPAYTNNFYIHLKSMAEHENSNQLRIIIKVDRKNNQVSCRFGAGHRIVNNWLDVDINQNIPGQLRKFTTEYLDLQSLEPAHGRAM